MTIKIFYSWQSDIPNNINRGFIEDAIKKAVKELSAEFKIEDAPRDSEISVDKDTQNIPGTPPIVDTILKKISACDIFIPDMTFVGKTPKGRLLPNPNVLIEYGWALKEVGHSRMIPIMNEAFGKPSLENLPFDMRHLRHPMSYDLPEDSDKTKRKEQKAELVKELKNAIKLIIDSGVLETSESSQNAFQERQPTFKPSLFTKKDETFTIPDYHNQPSENLKLPENNHLFLRLIPSTPVGTLTSKEAIDFVRYRDLNPLGMEPLSRSSERNKHGAFSYSNEGILVRHLSQLFKNKEIWGIDTACLDKTENMIYYEVPFGVIPCTTFEQTFYQTLKNYLNFAMNTLKLPLPLKLIAGATDVKGFQMKHPTSDFGGYKKYAGNVFEENLVWDTIIDDYNKDPSEIILPFFKYVWEECGLQRPDKPIFQ